MMKLNISSSNELLFSGWHIVRYERHIKHRTDCEGWDSIGFNLSCTLTWRGYRKKLKAWERNWNREFWRRLPKYPVTQLKALKEKSLNISHPESNRIFQKRHLTTEGTSLRNLLWVQKIFNKSSRSPRVGSAFMNSKKLTTLAKYWTLIQKNTFWDEVTVQHAKILIQ